MRAWNVILPWYEARLRVDLGGFAFVPRRFIERSAAGRMEAVAANFGVNPAFTIHTYTCVAVLDSNGLTWAIPDTSMPQLERARIAFAFSQLAEINPFADMTGFINANAFDLHRCNADGHAHNLSGSFMQLYCNVSVIDGRGPSIKMVRDDLVDGISATKPNTALHGALDRMLADRAYKYIARSIAYFVEGSGDTRSAAIDIRLALMATAFEQLSQAADGGKARHLAMWIGRLFDSLGTVESLPTSRADGLKDVEHDRWIHQAWLRDLYRQRNDLMHIEAKAAGGWSEGEHLLAACIIFPLAVKAELARSGTYELSVHDRADIMQVDRLLDARDWHNMDAGVWRGVDRGPDAWDLRLRAASPSAGAAT